MLNDQALTLNGCTNNQCFNALIIASKGVVL
jgi:hypothetical protein